MFSKPQLKQNKLYTQNGFFFQNCLMLISLKNLRIKTVQQGRIVTYLHSASENLVYNFEFKGNGLQFTPPSASPGSFLISTAGVATVTI